MNPDLEKLGRRAVATKHWRWIPGMMLCLPPRYEEKEPWRDRIPDWWRGADGLKDAYPDFADPATLGCLLALVREAWAQPEISTRYSEYRETGGEWDVPTPVEKDGLTDIFFFSGKTEAEALVAALEALP